MNAGLESAISESIRAVTNSDFKVCKTNPCSGGCINNSVILHGNGKNYFVKLNTAAKLEMFVSEAAGLETIYKTRTIRVPKPIVHGTFDDIAYLVLEAFEFGRSGDWEQMGRELAKLHRHTTNCFGWERENTIGSTPQHNIWTDNWADFFRDHRLKFQFELARKNGYHLKQADALLDSIHDILEGHTPAPSLLHGDLWSGNASFLSDKQPVIYDPACYYGDRETDLAFSEFFGGFPSSFYEGYQSEWPLGTGYERRKILYNLYHVLNHANLFGSHYATQAQKMTQQLLN